MISFLATAPAAVNRFPQNGSAPDLPCTKSQTKRASRIERTARSKINADKKPEAFAGPGLYSVRVHGEFLSTCYAADLPTGHRLAGLAVQLHYNRCTFPHVDRADGLISKRRFLQLAVAKVADCSGRVPVTLPVVLIPGNGDQLAEVIETLIAAVDRMDGDPDLEPSLGWTEDSLGGTDDREEENEYGLEA